MNNPFQDPGVAVYQDGECVQRPGLFNRLVRHVEERAVFGAIYGLPRVGKTSLVFRLIEHFRESEIMFVYIDLDAVSSDCHFARFWYDARKELCGQLGISNQESPCKDLSVERDAFLDTVVEAKRRGRTVVLVVDEFCTCLKYPPVEANAFIANFRSLMSGVGGPRRNLRRYFCCLTLSRRRPEKIQSMTGGSTLAGTISERFEVGVFTHDEFENQCAMVPDMTADQVSRLSELTHRHPYVAALVDKVLFSEKCSVDAAWDKVSSIVSGYYDDVSKLIAEATEAGVYVPEELKARCCGGSLQEQRTKDAEDHSIGQSASSGKLEILDRSTSTREAGGESSLEDGIVTRKISIRTHTNQKKQILCINGKRYRLTRPSVWKIVDRLLKAAIPYSQRKTSEDNLWITFIGKDAQQFKGGDQIRFLDECVVKKREPGTNKIAQARINPSLIA